MKTVIGVSFFFLALKFENNHVKAERISFLVADYKIGAIQKKAVAVVRPGTNA